MAITAAVKASDLKPGKSVQFISGQVTVFAVKPFGYANGYVAILVREDHISPYVVCQINDRLLEAGEWYNGAYFSGPEGAMDKYMRHYL